MKSLTLIPVAMMSCCYLMPEVMAAAPETLLYGSKPGMEVVVISKSGINTPKAVAKIKLTRRNAAEYCRRSFNLRSEECITEVFQTHGAQLNDTVHGDCNEETWVDASGVKYTLGYGSQGLGYSEKRVIEEVDKIDPPITTSLAYTSALSALKVLCPELSIQVTIEPPEAETPSQSTQSPQQGVATEVPNTQDKTSLPESAVVKSAPVLSPHDVQMLGRYIKSLNSSAMLFRFLNHYRSRCCSNYSDGPIPYALERWNETDDLSIPLVPFVHLESDTYQLPKLTNIGLQNPQMQSSYDKFRELTDLSNVLNKPAIGLNDYIKNESWRFDGGDEAKLFHKNHSKEVERYKDLYLSLSRSVVELLDLYLTEVAPMVKSTCGEREFNKDNDYAYKSKASLLFELNADPKVREETQFNSDKYEYLRRKTDERNDKNTFYPYGTPGSYQIQLPGTEKIPDNKFSESFCLTNK